MPAPSERRPGQQWPQPRAPLPIIIIGAGGVVRNAHLPAYRKYNLTVSGIYDIRPAAARAAAGEFGIPTVHKSLADAAAVRGAVFDVAVPADQQASILKALPAGSPVLIQKPFGRDLRESLKLLAICNKKRFTAAVNLQLRFSPNMLALRDAIDRGVLGDITDIEVRVNTRTPWSKWTFLKGIPRLEILYHSIHYLDLIRSFAGEPAGVFARAQPHPDSAGYADVRSSILLIYKSIRCAIYTNHNHPEGSAHAGSEFKIEGTRGAAIARMGVNLNYPAGLPDTLEFVAAGRPSRAIRLSGNWFPDAFAGTMSNLQRFFAGDDNILHTRVADAARTMALVEACYRAARARGTAIPIIKH
ncbi:MAG: Gfo/Idh/MocA family oxidoreductase [Planctomycetes bacterium]|nr:Gfo/Idh/MocA family oxidoreductase [Planctomycetota bacterium]